MIINQLLQKKKMTKYRLSKESGVPQTTVNDICSGKVKIEKCSVGTIYKIAKVLDVTVDSLIETELGNFAKSKEEYRCSFETFKSNIRHYVKDMGDLEFVIEILEKDKVRSLYKKGWYPETFYLLAMLDYLSRENDLPICEKYNDIRCGKLADPLFPASVNVATAVEKTERYKQEAVKNAIPEFLRFNIVEGQIRDVY